MIGQASYAVPSGAVFVANTGSDANSGTLSAPFATLEYALGAVADNGSIVIRAGIYHEGKSGQSWPGIYTNKNGITIQNYPGEAVWCDGSSVVAGWVQNGLTWNAPFTAAIDHSPTNSFGVNDSAQQFWQFVNPAYPMAPHNEILFIDGAAQTQVATLAEVKPGTFYVEETNAGNKLFTITKIHIGNDPTGKEVRCTDLTSFLCLAGANMTIRRYATSNAAGGALKLAGRGTVAENVIVEDIGSTGVLFYGDTAAAGNGQTARKMTVRRCGCLGMGINQAYATTIDRCWFEANNNERYNYAPESGALKATHMEGLVIKNSLFIDNLSKGVWTDESVRDIKIYSCDFKNNMDNATVLELSDTAIVANNLIDTCHSMGIFIYNTNNSVTWNNTLLRCGSADAWQYGSYIACFNQDDRKPVAGASNTN